MLRVVYEATQTLAPGELVEIHESRGRVHIKVQYGAVADDYLEPLNAALETFVKQCGWFQIWRGQIISADSPDSPLTVRYIADPGVDLRAGVQIRECQGVVRLHVCPGLPSEFLVRILNPAIEKFLAGKQWFQLWQGEIVTMDSPERVMV
ncbi:hypothetical protein OH540_09710 [Streptomyces sp. BPPL-273]|uniref:hypothetical protein n=1 Tax=unclassified Streptomyces TaxID=2593676 RepID=UPI0024AF7F93|nr:hypothetical protein [Streptomyces sp. BPPL-273]WHM30299.1 hypothetical protein OH540_09710 [Streptomyces sp. BPPL-273]